MRDFAAKVLTAYPGLNGFSPQEVSARGSTRRFVRVSDPRRTAIVVDASACPEEHAPYVRLSSFLRARGVPVPQVFAEDAPRSLAVASDLGGATLYDRAVSNGFPSVRDACFTAIEGIVSARAAVARDLDAFSAVARHPFDHDAWRWETDYFKREFLKGSAGLSPVETAGLLPEFEALADRACTFPAGFVHRDFQSTNIMTGPCGLGFVDFQGARLGPIGYDVASFVRDPYLELPADTRTALLLHARECISDHRGLERDADCFFECERVCALQRLCQALGAYGFLSRKRGRGWFAQFIPPALRLLKETVREERGMTVLLSILECCETARPDDTTAPDV